MECMPFFKELPFCKSQRCRYHGRVFLFRLTRLSPLSDLLSPRPHWLLCQQVLVYVHCWQSTATVPGLHMQRRNTIQSVLPRVTLQINWGSVETDILFFLRVLGSKQQPLFFHCGHAGLCAAVPFPLRCTPHAHACTHTNARRGGVGEYPAWMSCGEVCLSDGSSGKRQPLLLPCIFSSHFPPYWAVSSLRIRV